MALFCSGIAWNVIMIDSRTVRYYHVDLVGAGAAITLVGRMPWWAGWVV